MPPNPAIAGAKHLHDGFLGCEAGGKRRNTVAVLLDFALGVETPQKAIAMTLDRRLDAGDLDDVNANLCHHTAQQDAVAAQPNGPAVPIHNPQEPELPGNSIIYAPQWSRCAKHVRIARATNCKPHMRVPSTHQHGMMPSLTLDGAHYDER